MVLRLSVLLKLKRITEYHVCPSAKMTEKYQLHNYSSEFISQEKATLNWG
jgi:hypothetical protein